MRNLSLKKPRFWAMISLVILLIVIGITITLLYNPKGDGVQTGLISHTDEGTETLVSDDGKTIITVYTEEELGTYPIIKTITVGNKNGSFEINDMIGYYGAMQWAYGQSMAVIEYYGRLWHNFIIIDTQKQEVVFREPFTLQEFMDSFEAQGIVFNYKVNESRPDPEYRLNKVIDEDNIRIDYVVHDEEYVMQSGCFNYSLSTGTFSQLTQNEPKVEG